MSGQLLTPADAAHLLAVDERTLSDWRYRREGPPFLKLGHRTVRYAVADLSSWLEARTVEGGAS